MMPLIVRARQRPVPALRDRAAGCVRRVHLALMYQKGHAISQRRDGWVVWSDWRQSPDQSGWHRSMRRGRPASLILPPGEIELIVQAGNNTKAQFANSPTLSKEIMNAVMDALEAHTTMSKQAIASEKVREGLKDVLLGPAQLYEALRERAGEKEVEKAS